MTKIARPMIRPRIDVERVLAGTIQVNAPQLFSLIHDVNPTGRDLPPSDAARRYATKARLQSLLIRRFGDALSVDFDPAAGAGVVSLRLRSSDGAACHAVLDALDADARAWARMQLDLASDAAAGTASQGARPVVALAHRPGPPDGGGAADPFARADAAIDAFDYDEARRILEDELHGARDPLRAALTLLELLVDVLAADTDALALDSRLPPIAQKHPKARALLALAAARAGDERRAVRALGGVRDGHAADVFVTLASAALREGRIDASAAHLTSARGCRPVPPEVDRIAREVAQARAAQRAPAEENAMSVLAEGRFEEAARSAKEILATWPESDVAGRILRRAESVLHAEQRGKAVADADAAVARGDHLAAIASLRQALALGAGGDSEEIERIEGIERRLAELESAERARTEAGQVRNVCALLACSDRKPGYAAYMELTESLRARVATTSEDAVLPWLDTFGAARGNRARKIIDAVLAFLAAGDVTAIEPERALAILAPHESVLRGVAEADALLEDARARATARRHDHARTQLRRAQDAFDSGSPDRSEEILDACRADDFDDEARGDAERLRAEISAARALRERAATFERLHAAGDLLGARTVVDQIIVASTGEEKERWGRERAALSDEIRRAWHVHPGETPLGPDALRGFLLPQSWDHVWRWVRPGGRELVLARSHGVWVFVRVVDIETGVVRRTVWLRTPEPMKVMRVEVGDDSIWLLGEHGAVLQLATADWEVMLFRSAADVARPHRVIRNVAIAPPFRHLWVLEADRRKPEDTEARLVDLETKQTHRHLGPALLFARLAGRDEQLMLAFVKKGGAVVFDTCGVPRTRIDMPVRHPFGNSALYIATRAWTLLEGALDPSGTGIIAVVGTRAMPGGELTIAWTSISWTGSLAKPVPIRDLDAYAPLELVCAGDAQTVFVRFANASGGEEILALRRGTSGIEEAYRVPFPGEATLVQDPEGRRLFAFTIEPDGFHSVELGGEPPGPWSGTAAMVREKVESPACGLPTGSRAKACEAAGKACYRLSDAELLPWARAREADPSATPESLVEVLYAIGGRLPIAVEEMLERMFERFPDHPEIRLLYATRLTNRGDWLGALPLLAAIEPARLDDGLAQHTHHLLAMAQVAAGQFEQARATMLAGKRYVNGRCDLDDALKWTIPLPQGAGEEAWGHDASVYLQHQGMVAQADRLLAAGDPEGARVALDRPLVWSSGELQTLARLTQAYLDGASSDPSDFLEAMALAAFCEAYGGDDASFRPSIPVAGATWSIERMGEIARRARGWLEGRP